MKTWVAVAGVLVAAVAIVGGAVVILNQAGSNGMLSVEVTDAPAAGVTHLYLTISDLTLQGSGSSSASYKVSSASFDLLALTNVTKLIGSNSVAVGNYTMIRFTIISAVAVINGASVTLSVPSGEVKVPFASEKLQVKSGMTTRLVLDIVPDMTMVSASGNLSPVVHIQSITYVKS